MQYPPGYPGGPYDNNWMMQAIQQLRQEYDRKLNEMAGGLRKMTSERMAAADKKLEELGSIARALEVDRTGSGIVRIEDLPGRRVPYDLLVDIPIGNNTTSQREASVTISQDGPFVAVKRFATFQSSLEFQVTDEGGTLARFTGRSFGRYRPIHSAWDIFDANSTASVVTQAYPFQAGPPTSLSAFAELPGSMSTFRSMEFDGRILFENAGSSYPRQNISVPTPFWTTQINSPQDLAALDFFERGEVLTFRVQPNHVNNPPAGNVDGNCIFGAVGWPFLGGQYDRQEGICTPQAFTFDVEGGIQTLQTDSIQRLPDGILTIGFLGYRIQQPVGPLG